jgi:2,3-bisphosphoglycerate-independent phosphoglycerate mutase
MRGTALVEMPAEVGIARLLKMKMVTIKDRKDMLEKAIRFDSELGEGVVAYVHIKGPDEFGHDGDFKGKKKCIETIDKEFFSTAAHRLDDARIAVSCDHATPCTIKMHSSDPVPLLISGSKGEGRRFTERNGKSGSLGHLRGAEVLETVIRRTS